MTTWRNWAGNQLAEPARVETPHDTGEVVAAVQAAVRDGLTVRAVGSGHSFTAAACTDGVQLRPDAMRRVRSLDPSTGLVTVDFGLPLSALNRELAAAGRALTNMGDIDAQTVAGAISTGTHGTGRVSGSLSAQVAGLELVLADGSVVTCSETERPDLFAAARVGLGALGVVTAVTFRTEPAFVLGAVEEPMRWGEALDRLDELTADNEHFEFHWFPHADVLLTKRNNRVAGPARPLSRLRFWWEDEFVSNTLYGAICRVGRRVPAVIPRVSRLAGVLMSRRTYADASYAVFTSPRRVRFLESEFAVPRGAVGDVLRELHDTIDRRGWRISFPIEVRFCPADDMWLSTASGRDTAYVAIHQFVGTRDLADYFPTAERIFTAAGGRPHWGKLHTRDAEYLATVYPRFADFVALRDKLDPERTFANEYLTRVLG